MPFKLQAAQDSRGTEFWLAFLQNYSGTPNLQLFITSDVNTSGTVEIPGLSWSENFNVTANTTTTVNIPPGAQLTGSGIQDKAIHVTAAMEVTVYGLNQIQFTTDAYLGLPIDALNVQYRVAGYRYSSPDQFAVIAPYDNTTVEYTIPGQATQQVSLNQGQVFFYTANMELTGTLIESDNPVAVLGGNQCTNIPHGASACDHIVEQMPPVASWGMTFYTVPLATRQNGDTFRIVADSDNTVVNINGTLAATLDAGEYHEQIITGLSVIETSEPTLVLQYSNGTSYDGVTSDPFMMVVPPIEQALYNYTFSTPGTVFTTNFVNILAPDSIVDSILLDNSLIGSQEFTQIGTTGYSGAQVAVGVGSHTINGPQPIGIHSYGFADYDSYGYPGGMAFEFINPEGDANPPICAGSLVDGVFEGTVTDNRPSEDVNNNNELDDGEDLNDNGEIDTDKGVFVVETINVANATLNVDSFVPGAGVVSFTVEQVNADIRGLATIRGIDGSGNTCMIEVDLPGDPVAFESPAQPGGIGIQNYRLVSVPLDNVDGGTLADAIASGVPNGTTFGPTGDIRILLWDAAAQDYSELTGNPPEFSPPIADGNDDLAGLGFWRIARSTTTYSYEGDPGIGDPFEIPLMPGWNVFGFPFEDIEEIDVDSLQVTEGEGVFNVTAANNLLTGHTVWEYEDRDNDGDVDEVEEAPVASLYDAAAYIARGYAYWLYANTDGLTLLVPYEELVNGVSLSGNSRTNPSAPGLMIAAAEPAPPAPPAGMSSQSSGSGVSSAAGGGGGGCFIDSAFFGLSGR